MSCGLLAISRQLSAMGYQEFVVYGFLFMVGKLKQETSNQKLVTCHFATCNHKLQTINPKPATGLAISSQVSAIGYEQWAVSLRFLVSCLQFVDNSCQLSIVNRFFFILSEQMAVGQ
ncbi:MAG: hypothetical protein KF746_08745 [Chitinophagaceae bacterium]|nr:hypothetical protein [Chitinophagaceae bacterium]